MQAKIEMTFVISTSHWYHYNPLASIIRWCARTIICQRGDSESSSGINQTPFFLSLSFSLSAFYILSLISYINETPFLICILHFTFYLWSQSDTFSLSAFYILSLISDLNQTPFLICMLSLMILERPTFGCPTSQPTNWEVPEHCCRCWFELNTYGIGKYCHLWGINKIPHSYKTVSLSSLFAQRFDAGTPRYLPEPEPEDQVRIQQISRPLLNNFMWRVTKTVRIVSGGAR